MISLGTSIRWQIFLYYTLLIGVTLGVLLAMHGVARKRDLQALARMQLSAEALSFMPLIFPPANPRQGPRAARDDFRPDNTGSPRFRQAERRLLDQGYFMLAINREDQVVYRTKNAPELDEVLRTLRPDEQFMAVEAGDNVVSVLSSPMNSRVVAGMPRDRLDAQWRREVGMAAVWGLVIFAGASLLGFVIITRGLSPIRRISDTARRIASGDLSGRIDIRSGGSELGKLAGVLNETFARLQDVLQRQVRFTADASHELRTPVAAIIADCQFSLKRPRDAERYRETIEVCHESAQFMRSLIERLGLLAKFDAQEAPLARVELDLADVGRHALGVVGPIASQQGIPLTTDLQAARLQADPLRLGQVVINLLNNALRYNRPGGDVTLRTGVADGRAFIEVADTGIGIPADKLDLIFDRFYRVDNSRDAKTGGVGLGLAICRTIVEAHDGTLTVSSELGRGSCFRIELVAL